MNTPPDDALARAITVGQAGLRAMMARPPAARPRPLTLKAYLAELAPLIAEARAREYSDAEIAEALSIDAEHVGALGLEPLAVSVRALRQSCGHADRIAISASLKARKRAAKTGDARARKSLEPERHAGGEAIQVRGEAGGEDAGPTSPQLPTDPGVRRDASTGTTSPGSVERPADGRDLARTPSRYGVAAMAPPGAPLPPGRSSAPAPREVPPTGPLAIAAKQQAEAAAVHHRARGFHDRITSADPAATSRGETSAQLF